MIDPLGREKFQSPITRAETLGRKPDSSYARRAGDDSMDSIEKKSERGIT